MKLKRLLMTICLFSLVVLPFLSVASSVNAAPANTMTKLDDIAKGGGYTQYNKDTNSPVILVGKVINALLGLLGVVFLALMVYGGYLWMTDAGNSEQMEKAKKIIQTAIIGLVIVISSYAISYFVISNLQGSVLNTTG